MRKFTDIPSRCHYQHFFSLFLFASVAINSLRQTFNNLSSMNSIRVRELEVYLINNNEEKKFLEIAFDSPVNFTSPNFKQNERKKKKRRNYYYRKLRNKNSHQCGWLQLVYFTISPFFETIKNNETSHRNWFKSHK